MRSKRCDTASRREQSSSAGLTPPLRFPASSGSVQTISVLFPVVLRPLGGMVARLVHGGGVEEAAVDDGVEDPLAPADVSQGISVDHDEIGELAGLERSQIGVETQITRAVPGPALQCLVRCHASLDHHPELPVSAETLALAVRAQLYRNAGVPKLSGDPRDVEVIEILLGRHHAAHRAGVELGGRDEFRQSRVLPDVGVLIPVVLPEDPAVSDKKRGRVADAGLGPELQHVLVDPRDGQRVLDARVPVHDHRHVVLEERPSLGNDQHFKLARRGEDLLPLLAPRLVVALDAEGAHRLHPFDMRPRVKRMKAVGAFSVKSYNQPRREQRQQILAAARELEMLVVPEGGSLFEHNMTMVVDGHTGVEHTLPVPRIYKDVLQLWPKTGVGYTPTLLVGYGGIFGENYWYQHTNVWENPRLSKFVPPAELDARSMRRMMAPEEDFNHFNIARIAGELRDAGVSVQLGAHGQREGLGAHWELWMLAQGGMTPHQALKCGTWNGARYLGLDADLGSLEPGKLADLIVIDRLYDASTMNQAGNHPAQRPKYYWEKD